MTPILGIMASQISGHLFTPTGSMYHISTTTLSTTAATVTFSSIPTGYTHLQLRCLIRTNRTSGDGADLKVNFNSSSATYAFHDLTGDGSSAAAAAGTSDVTISLQRVSSDNTGGSNVFAGMVIDILDYQSTSKAKTVRSLGGYDNNGSGRISLSSGLWYATPAAITQIDLTTTATTSFKQYSTFSLYGVK